MACLRVGKTWRNRKILINVPCIALLQINIPCINYIGQMGRERFFVLSVNIEAGILFELKRCVLGEGDLQRYVRPELPAVHTVFTERHIYIFQTSN